MARPAKPSILGRSLLKNGATPEEIEFLRGQRGYSGYHGRRVELNAFTSRELVDWIEAKLREHGITKLIPDDETLEIAYRRATAARHFAKELPRLIKAANRVGAKASPPDDLDRRVRALLKRHPELPWEEAISRVANRSAP